MTIEEQLQAGISATRAGDLAKASALLIHVVRADPSSELGWLWLGLCRTDQRQREYCFRRVLEINPQNAEAKRRLELLQTSSYSAQGIQPPSRQGVESHEMSSPRHPPEKIPHPRSQKKIDNTLLWAGIGLGVFICFAVAGIYILGNVVNQTHMIVAENQAPTPAPTLVIAAPTPAYQPLFEPAPCAFQAPPQVRVDCGYVIVPEDRDSDPADTIRIAIAVYRTTSAAPQPDPILFLQGGPGGEAIRWSAEMYESAIAPLLSDRDLIVLDPRGVGYSEPVLECHEFGTTYLQDLQGKIPAEQRVSYYQGAMLGCKNKLVNQGVNLSAYTSIDMAADARDVLLALGYSQANLYGLSYGTRVAQFVMRHHPEMVRSAILDSVVPVEVQLFNQSPNERENILQTLFADCKADAACAIAYPDLEAVYEQVFKQLNTHPVHVSVPMAADGKLDQSINGYTFRNAVMWALRTPETIALAPKLIYRVRDGDYSTLILSLSFPLVAFDSIALGSYISVNCHDQVFALSMEDLDQTIFDLCSLWDIDPPVPGENDPVKSEIPTLIFAGRYDATTPPSFARQLAGHLPHSYVAEIPDQGHAPSLSGTSGCAPQLIAGFLQNPNRSPNLTCISEIEPIRFIIPYDGSTPLDLEPVSIPQYQLKTSVPTGWSEADYGFYNRNDFLGDMTQIEVQSTPISESAWVAWLSTNFGGSLGLDQPAVKVDQRQANGLTWSMYRTSAQGLQVDIAFAGSGNQTLMVLLVSFEDERDALYRTVFLPVMDATMSSR